MIVSKRFRPKQTVVYSRALGRADNAASRYKRELIKMQQHSTHSPRGLCLCLRSLYGNIYETLGWEYFLWSMLNT